MKICVIGIGYVGLSAALCFASVGHKVFCIDNNEEKINNLKKGILPIYEPQMKEMMSKYNDNLIFSTDLKNTIKETNAFFIAVGTPTKQNYEVDTTAIYQIADILANNIEKYTLIVNKSTVPMGFNKELKEYISAKTEVEFDIASNPEFLKQGSAIKDFLNPERIIIGTSSQKAKELILKIYEPFNFNKDQILIMDENSAQMVKYAANSFLALKISFMNEIATLCEKTGANIENIKQGLALDSRIGNKFLNAGIGYGGSCFPKDTKALVNIAKQNNINLKTVESTIEANEKAIENFVQKIIDFYGENIINKTFAFLGIAFKPNTNDTREAPSLKIINRLSIFGAKIKAYDPKAKSEFQVATMDEALNNADALIIATEWEEFKNIPIEKLLKLKDKVIFDGRNIYINKNLNRYGIQYYCVGKNEQRN